MLEMMFKYILNMLLQGTTSTRSFLKWPKFDVRWGFWDEDSRGTKFFQNKQV